VIRARDLPVVQALPGAEGQQLPVGRGQAGEGLGDLRLLGVFGERAVGNAQIGTQPAGERRTAALAPVVVGQHPPGHAVQPQPGFGVARDVVQPSPGGQERLGDDVGRVVGTAGAPQHVAQDRTAVRRVHRLEAALALSRIGYRRTRHDCSLRHQPHVRPAARHFATGSFCHTAGNK
jgi:hypothetical protein